MPANETQPNRPTFLPKTMAFFICLLTAFSPVFAEDATDQSVRQITWDHLLPKFIKVLPSDYERVLLALARAEEKGLKGDEAIQAAFEENVKAGH